MKKIAEIFKEDLKVIGTKKDFTYVTEVLVPLLNAEKSLPVCLHCFDRFNKKWLF